MRHLHPVQEENTKVVKLLGDKVVELSWKISPQKEGWGLLFRKFAQKIQHWLAVHPGFPRPFLWFCDFQNFHPDTISERRVPDMSGRFRMYDSSRRMKYVYFGLLSSSSLPQISPSCMNTRLTHQHTYICAVLSHFPYLRKTLPPSAGNFKMSWTSTSLRVSLAVLFCGWSHLALKPNCTKIFCLEMENYCYRELYNSLPLEAFSF